MTTKEDILGQFELFNIKPSEEVLTKCLEMCLKYKIDGEDLVDQWFAYTSSVLRGAAPTVDYLERMERKDFIKNKEHEVKKPVHVDEDHPDHPQSVALSPTVSSGPIVGDLSTPKRNHASVTKIQTPVQHRELPEEPMDVTTISTPGLSSDLYSKRTDARSLRCSHGPAEATFTLVSDIDLVIKPACEDSLRPNQKMMYEILRKRGMCIDNMTEDLAVAIAKKYKVELKEDYKDKYALFYGRIMSDADGKLNNQSVVLEQTQKFRGACLALYLIDMPKYSLFPGQVVVIKGSFLKGIGKCMDKLIVEEIYADANFNLLDEPAFTKDTLQLVVACGPFTVQDNLLFEPLNDLLQYVKDHKPHVLILTGPFYEKNHKGISNGELRQSFDSFFFDLVDNVMREVQNTHVVIVSSLKEPHHFPVYPTLPYEVRQKYPNLTFMPDPCMVNINGLVIGTTTADILFDIGSFEHHIDRINSDRIDRIGRLAHHLLKQQSFYPLDPPSKEVYIDQSLMETNGVMRVKPHILILPSNLRYFIKEIDNCVIINPERLTKGNSGGTFAKIEVLPGSTATVCGRTACQIFKV